MWWSASEVLLFEAVIGRGLSEWLFLGGSVAVAALFSLYLRWLGRRISRHGAERWRLTPRAANPLLPRKVWAFVSLAGFASSSSVLGWVGAVIAGGVWAVLATWGLERLDSRNEGSAAAQR